MDERAVCLVDECLRRAHRSGLCRGHYDRQLCGRTVHTPIRERPSNPWERLFEASLRVADVDDDREHAKAVDNLRKSALRYVQALMRKSKVRQSG